MTLINILASTTGDLEGDVKALSMRVILYATLILVILLVVSALVVKREKFKHFKLPLFVAIAATIILPSLLLVGSTVYVNVKSESKGPVHWHTDYELWVCGQEIEHRDPYEFLSNKIGTSTYHEHDDKRIHLEGVVVELDYDASLEKFMKVTEGEITNDSLTIATNENYVENDTDGDIPRNDPEIIKQFIEYDENGRPLVKVTNGQTCVEEEGPAEVQAFLFRYEKADDTYTQTKLAEPARYIMRDESIVPPGDCLIIEFDAPKPSTDRLCQQYGVRDAERCTEFGVSEFNPDLCNIRQTELIIEDPVEQVVEKPDVEVDQANEEENENALEGPCELESLEDSCGPEEGDE